MPSFDKMMADARTGMAEKYAREEAERQRLEREGRAAALAGVRWQVILVDGSPIDPDGPPGDGLAQPWNLLPDTVRAVLAQVAWAEPIESRCWRCGSPIGLVRDEASASAGVRWEPFGVVRRLHVQEVPFDEPASAQCVRCCPDQVADPWPADDPGAWWGDLSECSTSPDGSRVIHVTAPGAQTCRCQSTGPRMAPQVAAPVPGHS